MAISVQNGQKFASQYEIPLFVSGLCVFFLLVLEKQVTSESLMFLKSWVDQDMGDAILYLINVLPEGKKDPNNRKDKGPPMTIPNVPNNIVPIAFGPRAASAFIFDDNNKRINAGGSKCLVAQEYNNELPGIIPILVLIIGKK